MGGSEIIRGAVKGGTARALAEHRKAMAEEERKAARAAQQAEEAKARAELAKVEAAARKARWKAGTPTFTDKFRWYFALTIWGLLGLIALTVAATIAFAPSAPPKTPAQIADEAAKAEAAKAAAAAKAEAEKVAAKEQARKEAEARMAHNEAMNAFGQSVARTWLIGDKKLPGLDPKAEIGTFVEGKSRGLGPAVCGDVKYEGRRVRAIVERDVLYMEGHAAGFANLYQQICASS